MDGRGRRNKGKAGERQAAAYLRGLGFADARRTQQYNGKAGGKSDVVCDQTLPHVHIEVKWQKAFRLGTQPLQQACVQAAAERKPGQLWAVLWRQAGSTAWLLTAPWHGIVATVAGDTMVRHVLQALEEEGGWLDG